MIREKLTLQFAVALACLVPLSAGTLGVIQGAGAFGGAGPVDLDSHVRYLSGVFLGVGLGFASCVPRIEAMGGRFRLLGACVVIGGLARLAGVVAHGWPSVGHRFGLAMELVVVPLLLLWQWRVARLSMGKAAARTIQ